MRNQKTQIMTRILLSFMLFTMTVCGQSTIKEDSENKNQLSSSDWKTLDQTGYSIQYPSTWELNQSEQMATSFVLFSPIESDSDKFKDNVNLLIQDLTGHNLDIDKYTEISEGQIKTMVTNSILIESVRVSNDRGEYHKIIYTGDQGIFHLKFEQYYWVINDKAFVLTFTCEQDKYAEIKETSGKILNSFVLKK